MLRFEYPVAFLLLLLLILLRRFSRRQVRSYLSVSTPPQIRAQIQEVAKPPWIANLPSYCIYAFLFILIFLISEPFLGKQETYEIKESRSILVLLDTSPSMIQTSLLEQLVKGFLTNFIYKRPKEDRIAVARFDSDASGGIFTQNHQGLVLEVDAFDPILLSGKGTQIGIGLFKALVSFIEDEVETRIAEKRLSIAEQNQIYEELQDVFRRFLHHFRQRNKGAFFFEIPLVPKPEEIGFGKALIIITDGQLLEPTALSEWVNYIEILGYYKQLGFRHIYFISLKSRPLQLEALLVENPSWKAYMWDYTRAGLQEVFTEISKDLDEMEYGRSIVATRIKEQPLFHLFSPGLLLLLLATGLRFHKRIRRFP